MLHVALMSPILFLNQVPNPGYYGTHDFRRGHAKAVSALGQPHGLALQFIRCQDLQLSGAPLAEILAAGEWRSRAVLKYLDMQEFEKDVAIEAAMHSDNEEWID